MFCGHLIPFCSLSIILLYAFAFRVNVTQDSLAIGITMLCRHAIPFHGKSVILRNSLSLIVHIAQLCLAVHIPLICSADIPLHGLKTITTYTMAKPVIAGKSLLGTKVATTGSFTVQLSSSRIILLNTFPVKINIT